MPFDTSPLSQENILRDVHDPVTQTLRTTAAPTPGAATEAKQDDQIVEAQLTNTKLDTLIAGEGITKFDLDGVTTVVTKNTVTPANSRALPVEIMGTAGPINITAGDLNVQLSDTGANPDRTRIGDGTNQLGITASSEAKVSDATAQASLSAIDTKLAGTIAVSGPLTDAQLRASAVPVSAASLPLPTGAATETTLSALNTKVTAVDTGNVTVVSSALPAGAATAANQATQIASLSSVDSKLASKTLGTQVVSTDVGLITNSVIHGITTGVGGGYVDVKVNPSGALTTEATIVGTVPVSGPLTDAQLRASAVPVSVSSSALPADAATETTLAALNTKVITVDTGNVAVTSSALPSGAATSAAQATGNASLASIDSKLTAPLSVTGPLTDTQLRASAVAVSATALPLPTGAATETTLTAVNAKLPANLTVSATRLLVDSLSSGRSKVQLARIADYSSTPVTTATYVQIIASTSATANMIEIFDSSGETLVLAFGGSGSEVDQMYVNPGGNGLVPLLIPAGTRVSVKAVSNNISTVGAYLNLTLYS